MNFVLYCIRNVLFIFINIVLVPWYPIIFRLITMYICHPKGPIQFPINEDFFVRISFYSTSFSLVLFQL